MKILGAEQLSSEWFQAHCGVVSGSHMAKVLDFAKRSGAPGKKRQTYQETKLAELLTGVAIQDNYVSREMLEGIEREPAGRGAYEIQEQVMVREVGFALHDELERFGGSVDGLVGEEGMLELKCPKANTHLKWILACRNGAQAPADHLPQIHSYLTITGRAWCDFVSYCPMLKVKELRLMVVRVDADPTWIRTITDNVARFNSEIDQQLADLREITGVQFTLPAAEAVKFQRPGEGFTEDEEEMLGISDDEIRSVDPSWSGGAE